MSDMIKPVHEWLLEYHIPYKTNGNDYIIKCPFHNDKTPSLSMDRETGAFQCWSCKAKGNMATFISRIANCDIQTAVNIVFGKSTIKFKKKEIVRKVVINEKYNEIIQLIYCFLFRDDAVVRLLNSIEEFADDKIFDELIECQKKIISPDKMVYLKQLIFNEILNEVDDVLIVDRYKKLLELAKDSMIRGEIKMALNLYNNNRWKDIYAYLDMKNFVNFVYNFDINYDEYTVLEKALDF